MRFKYINLKIVVRAFLRLIIESEREIGHVFNKGRGSHTGRGVR